MTSDLMLPRKWTLRARGQQVVFVKKRNEKSSHVVMKALLWALYLEPYPDLAVEIRIGDRFKPDVVSLDERGEPRFWGESGQVGVRKLASIFKRFPRTHFAIAKWNTSLRPHADIIEGALKGMRRTAAVDLLRFDEESVEQFVDERGEITLSFADVEMVRFDAEPTRS